ncbi:histidinol dehydrogenase [Patescibacteria group bacterium]
MKTYLLKNLGTNELNKLVKRPAIKFDAVFEIVKGVLSKVKNEGDSAIKMYTEKFDGVALESFEVKGNEIAEACLNVPADLKRAFKIAKTNIEKFHEANTYEGKKVETSKGVICYKKNVAIEKVGLYIPGGTAPLPSTVLMLAVPAKIAGCKDIIMCTPPDKNGNVPDIILYVANLAGVTKIYKIGGAQAIAAMAYGSETVKKVYKIFGPGNQYVTAAKMLASIDPDGSAIDMPAGPSEVLVIADNYSRADFVAADLLSQAEHGPDSQVVLVCNDNKKCEEILDEVKKQLKLLPRKDIAKKALDNSFALIVENLEEAFKFSNKYAPEHLILNFNNAEQYTNEIINAGSVFIGQYSCESAGDYASGTNHTLPTYGYAKNYSGVNTEAFVKKITYQKISKEGVKNLGPVVEKMAEVEELQGHKNAMTIRINSIT